MHIHNCHGPVGRREHGYHNELDNPDVVLYAYALVVVRRKVAIQDLYRLLAVTQLNKVVIV